MLEELECPHCGENYLHQIKVDVFQRSEDEESVFHVQVGNTRIAKTAVVNNNRSGNPSLRRNGLTITFSCETCEETPKLDLAQHKGCTLVTWRK